MIQPNRDFKDTGYLTDQNSSVVGSGETFVVFLDPRFQPYNDIKILNLNTSNDVEVNVNQHSKQLCPSGTQLQINQQVINDLRLKNIGSTDISISDLRVFYRNDGFRGRELKQAGVTALGVLGAVSKLW